MKFETVTALARRFGLSRSTLLYYDRIGLLKPSGRTAADYRTYTTKDAARLSRICRFREAGLTLADIASILNSRGKPSVRTLENRMEEISNQLAALKNKQRLLAAMLRQTSSGKRPPLLDKAMWVELLRAGGMDDRAMLTWHREFERRAPMDHQRFLESLGIPTPEIARIRQMSSATD